MHAMRPLPMHGQLRVMVASMNRLEQLMFSHLVTARTYGS